MAAEYRILLRQDNADRRLTHLGHKIGLVSDDRMRLVDLKYSTVDSLEEMFDNTSADPAKVNDYLQSRNSSPLPQKRRLSELLSRPQIDIESLIENIPQKGEIKEKIVKVGDEVPLSKQFNNAGAGENHNIDIPYQTPTNGFTKDAEAILDNEILESVEIAVKYRGYIQREQRIADKILKLEDVRIPDNFDFLKVSSLSIESRQKLMKHRPTTIAQASRIPGVSPADVSVLLVYFGR